MPRVVRVFIGEQLTGVGVEARMDMIRTVFTVAREVACQATPEALVAYGGRLIAGAVEPPHDRCNAPEAATRVHDLRGAVLSGRASAALYAGALTTYGTMRGYCRDTTTADQCQTMHVIAGHIGQRIYARRYPALLT